MLSSDQALVENVGTVSRSDGGLQGFPLVVCEGRGMAAVDGGLVLAILNEEKMVVIDLVRWFCRRLM